ncbi:MAG: inositol monophosphatase [Burkholderiales bacterium]|nr:inositol monophosphatase [Burkholderiales bacterium]
MQNLDTHFMETVSRHVQSVAQSLLRQFETGTPVQAIEQMFQAFQTIDDAASEQLRQALAQDFPDIAWLEGEFELAPTAALDHGDYWICDAIDGAVQFLRGLPYWCVALTLLRNGEPVLAIVHDPVHQEIFHAIRGQGAYLNGEAIHVNQQSSYRDAILATSQPPFIARQPWAIPAAGAALQAFLPEALAIRNLGPTALQLAYVACGRLDGFWQFGQDGFNCLGAGFIVREAGGLCTDVHGRAYQRLSSSLVAAPPATHASLLEKLASLSLALP